MRWDQTGIFWDDYVPPKVKIEKIKREPPEPVWLADDYLPDLDRARAYEFNLMSDAELDAARMMKDRLIWDLEIYPNFFLGGFKNARTKKIVKFEMNAGELFYEDLKFGWILRNFCLVGQNDSQFDGPIASALMAGYTTEQLAGAANDLIHGGPLGEGLSPHEFYKVHKISPIVLNQIDLLQLTPLGPGLKICAGRMHAPRMADLPFKPGKNLTEDQKTILRWYWVNDLDNTDQLHDNHKTAIELREALTDEYGTDVRSKSDPQVAEAIIRAEMTRLSGKRFFQKATIEPGRSFRFIPPQYLYAYPNESLRWLLDFVRTRDFVVDGGGSVPLPEDLAKLVVPIGQSQYQMGIGGLHSKEKSVVHIAGEDEEITDNDVTSYYPSLMIQQGMYPPNIGPVFLQVFKRLYDRRVAAKDGGDKRTAETLKIVLNGTFGKTGERGGHSVVYYPEMMIQTTLSGQLSLLMLVFALEDANISVISANTDGIIVKCKKSMLDTKAQIIEWWQETTGLRLESKAYAGIYSRDINNYIALLTKPDEKETTAHKYAKSVGAYRKVQGVYPLKWNPTCEVCNEAVIAFLATGKPIEQSIREETDIRKFIEVRRVTNGAAKDGVYLGKAIRWYYSTEAKGEILNVKSGYVVPRSDGGMPCMTLPDGIPKDLNYQYYIDRAVGLLSDFEPKVKKNRKAQG